MPPKKESAPVPEETDPGVIAAREVQERKNADERASLDQSEVAARQRISHMERLSWRCVHWEKEKRTNPEAWDERIRIQGPQYIFVKSITGNRASCQLNIRVPLKTGMTIGDLKRSIQDHVGRNVSSSMAAWYAADCQVLLLNGRELGAQEVVETPRSQVPTMAPSAARDTDALSGCGVQHGMTIHSVIRSPAPHLGMAPSNIR